MTSMPERAQLRAHAWNTAMTTSPGELDLRVPASDIDGGIPELLRGGRLLSNGPGWTRIAGVLAHPFDGHGYLRAFAFDDDGSCSLRARFVETDSYRIEAAAGRLVRPGLGTRVGRWGLPLFGSRAPRNVANTTVTRWGDTLLAGWEGGVPHAIDPDSLATRGEHDFGGAVAEQATLAHFKLDHARGRLIACSVANGRQTQFTFREFDRDERVVATRGAAVEGMVFAHDFAISPRWYVLGGNPLEFRLGELGKLLVGRSTMLRAVTPRLDQPGSLVLVPRAGDGPVRIIALPDPAFVVHFGNAFERDGAVIVDACVFRRFELGQELGYRGPDLSLDPTLPERRGAQRLVRFTIPAGASEASCEQLVAHGVDFPRVHPEHDGQPTPALFGATRSDTRYSDPFDSILRVDLDDLDRPPSLWTAPEHVFVGEPVFVPEPGAAKAGCVLALLSDALHERTILAVFDAEAIDRGPVARVPLPLLPIAFHGAWDPPASR